MIIGTRGSALALAQANLVAGLIRKKFRGVTVTLQVIKTTGDKILDAPLAKIGSKGLFTKELEDALLRRDIDLAVHSLKDLPPDLPAGLMLGAVLKRADVSDCLVSAQKCTLKSLKSGAVVGTSSLRRQAQLLALRPDVRVESLRGNLDTRLSKLRSGRYDAIILASAGLARLNQPKLLKGLYLHKIPASVMLPAAGQGALAVEIRKDDAETAQRIGFLNHAPTRIQADCERAFLEAVQGGCQIPIGIHSRISGGRIFLDALVASVSGDRCIREKVSGPVKQADSLGKALGKKLLSKGGRKILAEIRK